MVNVFKGHTGKVRALHIPPHQCFLYSASSDKTGRCDLPCSFFLWFSYFFFTNVLFFFSFPVFSVFVHFFFLVRKWNIKTGHCLAIIEGHGADVCSVHQINLYDTPYLITAAEDGSVRYDYFVFVSYCLCYDYFIFVPYCLCYDYFDSVSYCLCFSVLCFL